MTSVKRIAAALNLILLLGLSSIAFSAGQVDTTFRAYLAAPNSGAASVVLPLPDGKVLVSIRVPLLNGFFVGDLVRLNPNGNIDTTFNPPVITTPQPNSRSVNALGVQADGKVLIGGNFITVNGVQRNSLARLNTDGSLDTTFPNILGANRIVDEIFVYPDGRILIGGTLASTPGPTKHLIRLSPEGVIDPTFDYAGELVSAFAVQPDGKIIVADRVGTQSSFLPRVRRYNDNGSVDPTFTQIDVQNNSGVFEIVHLPDGKTLVGGSFVFVNGVIRSRIFRANSDGTIDDTLQDVGVDNAIYTIVPDAGGKFFIGGNYTRIGGVETSRRMHRINPDGTRDNTFSLFESSINSVIEDLAIQDGKIIVASHGGAPIVRALATNGGPDTGFVAPIPARTSSSRSVRVQSDNKILVGGSFTLVNGEATGRCGVVRLNPDGTTDGSFTASFPCSLGVQVLDVEVQPDGKVLVAGLIGGARRFNTNGTFDVGFPGTDLGNWAIDVLPDGKVLVAGGTLKRFNASGSLDTTLATVDGVQFPNIYNMAVQPDGKTIIVGHFTLVNGQSRNYIARINPDGSVDATFNAAANQDVSTVVLQPDGKIIIGGGFTSVNSDPTKRYLVRLNSNGSIDSSFSANLDGPVIGMKVQSDGRVIIGGAFATIDGVLSLRMGRVNSDGSRDSSFNIGASGVNSTVWSIDQQSDGKIVYAGEFTKTDGYTTLAVGRLLNTPASRPFDYDGDGKADVSVFRPSENRWYVLRSSDSSIFQPFFGTAGDVPVPADFDGDQKTDIAIYRPSNGQWWYLSSLNGSQVLNPFGSAGDIPRPSDFDGDGKADLIIFRPSNSTWYRYSSATNQEVAPLVFGLAGDQPLIGDFDGDGKSDPAIFRPSNGDWWYAASSAGGAFRNVHWGQNGDLPVPADYDGDSKTDYAVFRPSDGGWYIYNSSNGSFTTTAFGTNGDRPVAADYDGDGRADLAVFRPSSGLWYLLRSTSGFTGLQLGISTDRPTPNAFIP